jgi:hypothetical protein
MGFCDPISLVLYVERFNMGADQVSGQVNFGNLVLDDLAIEYGDPSGEVVKDFLVARRPAGFRPDFKHQVGNIALAGPSIDKQKKVASGKTIVENPCPGALDVP